MIDVLNSPPSKNLHIWNNILYLVLQEKNKGK